MRLSSNIGLEGAGHITRKKLKMDFLLFYGPGYIPLSQKCAPWRVVIEQKSTTFLFESYKRICRRLGQHLKQKMLRMDSDARWRVFLDFYIKDSKACADAQTLQLYNEEHLFQGSRRQFQDEGSPRSFQRLPWSWDIFRTSEGPRSLRIGIAPRFGITCEEIMAVEQEIHSSKNVCGIMSRPGGVVEDYYHLRYLQQGRNPQ